MPTVRKSVIVPRPCPAMYALVDDAERYREFLPWCPATRVLERTAVVTRARLLEITLGPVFGHITETLVDHFVARAEALA